MARAMGEPEREIGCKITLTDVSFTTPSRGSTDFVVSRGLGPDFFNARIVPDLVNDSHAPDLVKARILPDLADASCPRPCQQHYPFFPF